MNTTIGDVPEILSMQLPTFFLLFGHGAYL